jgi:alkaline phosphatase D
MAAGTQAYFEWMPVREGVPGRIYRELPYGDLVDLIVLDTRYEGRDEPRSRSPPRHAIEADQRSEIASCSARSRRRGCSSGCRPATAQWKLIAQQVMMGQIDRHVPGQDGEPNRPLITDPWDGFEAARRTIYELHRRQRHR